MKILDRIFKYEWWCPQCGTIKRTRKNSAPLCKGSIHPQDWNFHLFHYRMEKIDGVAK